MHVFDFDWWLLGVKMLSSQLPQILIKCVVKEGSYYLQLL